MIFEADIIHIESICDDVSIWYALYMDAGDKELAGRMIPGYLLAAYTRNLLEYSLLVKNKKQKMFQNICDALYKISEIVMRSDFDDIGCRAEILDIFHRYGNSEAGQQELEL